MLVWAIESNETKHQLGWADERANRLIKLIDNFTPNLHVQTKEAFVPNSHVMYIHSLLLRLNERRWNGLFKMNNISPHHEQIYYFSKAIQNKTMPTLTSPSQIEISRANKHINLQLRL